MSAGAGDQAASGAVRRGFARLPAWLAPRDSEPRGTGDRWVVETTLLVLVGVLLLVAIANDLHRQSGINARLSADLHTWRQYTGHQYQDLAIDMRLLGENRQHEVVCGNTGPGRPDTTPQLCLMIWGPIRGARRTVHGGWYIPPYKEDISTVRYGCFGAAARRFCRR